MNKEVEEAKEILKNFIEIHRSTKNDLLTMEDSVSEIRTRVEEKVLNYIEELEKKLFDSTSNSVIREKIEIEKQTQKDIQRNNYDENRMKAVNERILILEEILKEGEK